MSNNLYQLILIDKETGQPQKVESITGYLDLSSAMQLQLYLDTLNHLTPNSQIKSVEGEGTTTITIHLEKNNKNISELKADVYKPDEE